MRCFILLMVALAGAPLLPAVAGMPDAAEAKLWVSSWSPPAPLPASRAVIVKDGITLRQMADAFGPGWMTPNEGVGIMRWFFDDGRQLSVWPHEHKGPEVVTFKGDSGRARMWWQPSEVIRIKAP